MSDFNSVRQKVEEGAEWRGTIRVPIEGEEHELTVRQLYDPELYEVLSLIDRDELQELRADLPGEEMERFRELQRADELDEDEEDEYGELREKLEEESGNMFDVLSDETFEGIRRCAKYAIEPDEEDLREAFVERAAEIESEYGVKVQTPGDVRPAIQDDIDDMIDRSTGFISFTIGIQALVETVGEDEGN